MFVAYDWSWLILGHYMYVFQKSKDHKKERKDKLKKKKDKKEKHKIKDKVKGKKGKLIKLKDKKDKKEKRKDKGVSVLFTYWLTEIVHVFNYISFVVAERRQKRRIRT